MLATDPLKKGENPLFQFLSFFLPEYWTETKGYETMILKFDTVRRIHCKGYYVERYETFETARKRHNELKKLILEKRFVVFHQNKMPGLVGEFVFE